MLLDNLSGSELVALAGILAIYFSDGLSANQTATLGDFFSSLGSNLTLISDTKQWIYISLRPSKALLRVTSSVYSKSPPTGIPWAILVTVIPIGLINFDR